MELEYDAHTLSMAEKIVQSFRNKIVRKSTKSLIPSMLILMTNPFIIILQYTSIDIYNIYLSSIYV